MTRKHIIIAAIVAGSLIAGCRHEAAAPVPVVKDAGHTFSVRGSVREMTIMPETVEFPEHAGKQEFTAYCGICHSLRYISMQPAFPRKTWEAEVEKMVVKYGAPIDSVNGRKIVDYLVAVKGNGS
ncbi:MAG: hypothetical protein V4649_15230 [Bacteroidota bacterium]